MMEVSTREQDVLNLLQRQYEADGFRFVQHPPESAVPDFLRAMQPDAIAYGPKRNVIIEIKSSRRLRDHGRLAQMAQILQQRDDWQFKIFYADDLSAADDVVPVMEKRDIENELTNIRQMVRDRSSKAAFVLVWALVEAATRRLGQGTAHQSPKAASSVAELLGREGLISDDEARRLLHLATVRNAIVHGDLTRSVPDQDIEFLARIAERLNART